MNQSSSCNDIFGTQNCYFQKVAAVRRQQVSGGRLLYFLSGSDIELFRNMNQSSLHNDILGSENLSILLSPKP